MTCIDVHLHVSVVALSKFKVMFIHLSLSVSLLLFIDLMSVLLLALLSGSTANKAWLVHHVGFHAKQTQVARVWDIPNMHHQNIAFEMSHTIYGFFYQNGWTGSQSSSNQLVNWIRQLTWVHSLISLLSRPSRTALDTREDFVTLCHVTRSWISEICTGTFPPLLLTAA